MKTHIIAKALEMARESIDPLKASPFTFSAIDEAIGSLNERQIGALEAAQDSAIRLQHTVDALRDVVNFQEAFIRQEITTDQIQRLQDALEGYCDGLAIEENTAKAILNYVFTGLIEDDETSQNYNCPCAHPSQCDNSCFEGRKSSERAAAVKGEEGQ